MSAKTTLLPNRVAEVATCTFCPKMCRFACPVDKIEGNESTSPWGQMTTLGAAQTGMIPLETAIEVSYHCTGCRACNSACLHNQQLPPIIEEVRALAAKSGLAHPRLVEKDEKMRQYGNPVGPELTRELGQLVPASRFGRPAGALLFFGCTTVKKYPRVVEDTMRVLETSGIDFAVAGPEKVCSGLPSLQHGFVDRMREVARRNIETFRSYPRVISDCPGAVSTFAREYPKLGLPATTKAEHLSQLLLELLREGRLSPRMPRVRKAFYHDACHLGRYLGVHDQPRELLERILGGKAQEFAFSRELSLCSGGGGGLPLTVPETAAGISRLATDEVRSRGGDMLVSACPTARRNFQKADSEMEVVDPVTLLARSL